MDKMTALLGTTLTGLSAAQLVPLVQWAFPSMPVSAAITTAALLCPFVHLNFIVTTAMVNKYILGVPNDPKPQAAPAAVPPAAAG